MSPRRSGSETASSTTAEIVELLTQTRANTRPVVSTSTAAENSTGIVATRTAEDSASTRDRATVVAMHQHSDCVMPSCRELSYMGAVVCPRHMSENMRGLEEVVYGAGNPLDSRTHLGVVPRVAVQTVFSSALCAEHYGSGLDLELLRSETRWQWELSYRGRRIATITDQAVVQSRTPHELIRYWITDTCRRFGLFNDARSLLRHMDRDPAWAEGPQSRFPVSR